MRATIPKSISDHDDIFLIVVDPLLLDCELFLFTFVVDLTHLLVLQRQRKGTVRKHHEASPPPTTYVGTIA